MAKLSEDIRDIEDLKEEILDMDKTDAMKVKDFWTRHNFGTRLSLVVFMVSFLSVVVSSFFGIVSPDSVIDMVFYSSLIAYMTVTLGINGLEKLLDGIAKIKLGK